MSMSRDLLASNTIRFDADSGPDGARIVLEFDPVQGWGGYPPWPVIIRHYPAEYDDILTNIGTVTVDKTKRLTEPLSEWIRFSGGNSAAPRYPAKFISTTPLIGKAIDKKGKPCNPHVIWNPDTRQFESDLEFYGYFFVTYQAEYLKLTYKAGTYNGGSFNGMVLSFWKGATATLDIPPQSLGSDTRHFIAYTVTSKYLVNEDGSWEYPKDWPDSPYYEGNATEPPEPDGCMEAERVHENGILYPSGGLHIEQNPVISWLQPFTGYSSYKPVYSLRRAGAPAEEWALNAWQNIDWGKIDDDLAARYPGITL